MPDVPEHFLCPIYQELMRQPVMLGSTGHTFERRAIEEWLQVRKTDPLTNVALDAAGCVLSPNHALAAALEQFVQQTQQGQNIPWGHIQIKRRDIGHGAFKDVHEGVWRGLPVAVLHVRNPAAGAAQTAKEAQLFLRLGSHPYLIRFYGRTTDADGRECLVTEFAKHKSLTDLMAELDDEGEALTDDHRIAVLQQIAMGMQHMHEVGVIHRDLAARNVFVSRFDAAKPEVTLAKIGDYGLAAEAASHYSHSAGAPTPIRWMAPESLTKRRFGKKTDVFSFAVFAWELYTDGDLPWGDIGTDEVVSQKVRAGERLPRPPACPEGVWQLVQKCWSTSPADRPHFEAVGIELRGLLIARRKELSDGAVSGTRTRHADAAAPKGLIERMKREAGSLYPHPHKDGHQGRDVPNKELHQLLATQLSDTRSPTGLAAIAKNTQEFATVRKAMQAFFGTDRILCIRSIKRVRNGGASKRFAGCKTIGARRVEFKLHGTKAASEAGIVSDGFRLPTEKDSKGRFVAGEVSKTIDPGSRGDDDESGSGFLKFGGGVYFTSHATKADVFGGWDETVVFLSALQLGRAWHLEHEDYRLGGDAVRQAGYDSVFSKGTPGKKVLCDEFVLYNTEAILPMYAVRYRTVRVRTAGFFLAQMQAGQSRGFAEEASEVKDVRAAADKVRGAIGVDDVAEELACLGDACRDSRSSVAYLESPAELHCLLRGLTADCEVTQWQTLRLLANFSYSRGDASVADKRQKLLHDCGPRLFKPLCELLRGQNEAVVQKAANVACNMCSGVDLAQGGDASSLIDALVAAVRESGETMTTLYTSAALCNAVRTSGAARDAAPAVEEISDALHVARCHGEWGQWAFRFLRNFVQSGAHFAQTVLRQHGVAEKIARVLDCDSDDNDDPTMFTNAHAVADLAKCLAWAGQNKEFSLEFIQADGVQNLTQLMDRKPAGEDADSLNGHIAQAIFYVCRHDTAPLRGSPVTLRTLARHFKTTNKKFNKYNIARALDRLDATTLAQYGLNARTVHQAANDDVGVSMPLAKTSTADNA